MIYFEDNVFIFSQVGLIYIFNLIVGTGALTLPAVFSRAGWLLGVIVILILGLIR